MKRVVLMAPGKVNLALQILARREDGYHLMEMIMQSVSLADQVSLTLREDSSIHVTSDDAALTVGEDNLAVQCARLFYQATGLPEQGLDIYIEKRIPVEAGLAGGSADGAAVLAGLNWLLGTNLPLSKLCEIGVKAGADIPFCLVGSTALTLGIGERVIPLPPLPECSIVIAKPEAGMSTAKAFGLYDQVGGFDPDPSIAGMLSALKAGCVSEIGRWMSNAFEKALAIPQVEELKGIMMDTGSAGAVMSGSGTATIGIFTESRNAESCLLPLRNTGVRAWRCTPLVHGVKILEKFS